MTATDTDAHPRHRGWVAATVTAVALRVGLGLLLAHVALQTFSHGSFVVYPGSWLGAFLRWDSGFYVPMAQLGYPISRYAAFFPGYPLLVRAVHASTGGALPLSATAVLVSWACFAAGAVAVHSLLRRHLSARAAAAGTWLLVWSPVSFFWLAAYPEALLTLLAAGSLLALGSRRWWLAALLAGAAAATSPIGVAVSAGVAVGVLVGAGWWRGMLAAPVALWGLVGYCSYQAVRFGSLIEMLTEERAFARHTTMPWWDLVRVPATLGRTLPIAVPRANSAFTVSVNLAFAALSLVAAAWLGRAARARRIPVGLAVYGVVGLAIPNASLQVIGGVANPEGVARLVSDCILLYLPLGAALGRSTFLEGPLLAAWAATGVLVQTIDVLGFYFT